MENPVYLIQQKRDGSPLTPEQIRDLIAGFVAGDIPDYQMAAFAMAVFFRGMDETETTALTRAMLESGETLDWTGVPGVRVGKHSSGGVGDKISLVLAPLLAALGLQVPKLSGRGLGPSGGTIDKLEAIPGMRTSLSLDEIRAQVERVGCVISSATDRIVPADRMLYALRDATATVPSIALITSSIMSKKLAENLNALVLDVKCGSGAFLKDLTLARRLAEQMTHVGKQFGVPTVALISDMAQPLGKMVGNAVEVLEARDTLSGGGPPDVRELTLTLAAELQVLAGSVNTMEEGRRRAADAIGSGAAYAKLDAMIAAQGGDPAAPLVMAPATQLWTRKGGFVHRVNAEKIAYAVIALGGGRIRKGDAIDHAVGVEWLARVGEKLEVGQPFARLFARERGRDMATQLLQEALVIGPEPIAAPPLILGRVA